MSQLHFPQLRHLPSLTSPEAWYAVRTRSNFERAVASVLASKGFSPFLPAYRVKTRWSDRVVETEKPLFPGYLFCRFDPISKRLPILTTPGVVSVLGSCGEPEAVPDHEIEAVEAVLRSGRHAEPHAFLREGQRVRVNSGSLEGLEGLLLRRKSDWRLLISVTMLNRSLSVEVDRETVSPV